MKRPLGCESDTGTGAGVGSRVPKNASGKLLKRELRSQVQPPWAETEAPAALIGPVTGPDVR